MATVDVTIEDYDVAVNAALTAQRDGDMDAAHTADRLARRIYAALITDVVRGIHGPRSIGLSWKNAPSVLANPGSK